MIAKKLTPSVVVLSIWHLKCCLGNTYHYIAPGTTSPSIITVWVLYCTNWLLGCLHIIRSINSSFMMEY